MNLCASNLKKITTRELLAVVVIPVITTFGMHAQISAPKDLDSHPETTIADPDEAPKNLARWHTGATLIVAENGKLQRIRVPDISYFEESVFLSDNSALAFSIKAGKHSFIVDLGQSQTVSRFFLNNKSAAGSLQLLHSDTLEPIDSNSWTPITPIVYFTKDTLPSVTFPDVNTRYVLVRFHLDDNGFIGNLNISGRSITTETTAEKQDAAVITEPAG